MHASVLNTQTAKTVKISIISKYDIDQLTLSGEKIYTQIYMYVYINFLQDIHHEFSGFLGMYNNDKNNIFAQDDVPPLIVIALYYLNQKSA